MIYFDHAATAYPHPEAVLREIRAALTDYGGNPGRSGHRLSLRAAEKIDDTRVLLSDFLSLRHPERIVFTLNATYAINLAIKTSIESGMHVLISNREHNAVYRPIAALEKSGAVSYDIFDSTHSPKEALTPLLRPKTKLLILNHVSNVTGEVANAKEYAAFCRQNGITMLLDASQSLGHLRFSAEEIESDIICAPAHKGLLGIQGCGFVYFREKRLRRSFIEGGSGSLSLSPEMPELLPDRYEAGTLPTPAIAGLYGGLSYLCDIGIDAAEAHSVGLRRRAAEMLSSLPHVRVLAPEAKSSVISFVCDRKDPSEIGTCLDKEEICVRTGYHCAPLAHAAVGTLATGSVRLSFGYGNTTAQLEAVYRTLKEII